jgi:hypothetical protein
LSQQPVRTYCCNATVAAAVASAFAIFAVLYYTLLSLLLMPPLRSHFFVLKIKGQKATGSDMPFQKIHHILYSTVTNAWFYRDGGSGKAPAESGRSVPPTKQGTGGISRVTISTL